MHAHAYKVLQWNIFSNIAGATLEARTLDQKIFGRCLVLKAYFKHWHERLLVGWSYINLLTFVILINHKIYFSIAFVEKIIEREKMKSILHACLPVHFWPSRVSPLCPWPSHSSLKQSFTTNYDYDNMLTLILWRCYDFNWSNLTCHGGVGAKSRLKSLRFLSVSSEPHESWGIGQSDV